jgi:hypothetical protein
MMSCAIPTERSSPAEGFARRDCAAPTDKCLRCRGTPFLCRRVVGLAKQADGRARDFLGRKLGSNSLRGVMGWKIRDPDKRASRSARRCRVNELRSCMQNVGRTRPAIGTALCLMFQEAGSECDVPILRSQTRSGSAKSAQRPSRAPATEFKWTPV